MLLVFQPRATIDEPARVTVTPIPVFWKAHYTRSVLTDMQMSIILKYFDAA